MSEQDSARDVYYRQITHAPRRGPASEYEQPYQRDYSADAYERNRFGKVSSEQSLKNQRKSVQANNETRLPTRRQNQVISNLRNQLKNIKTQVAKLMNKDDIVELRYQEPKPTDQSYRPGQDYRESFADNSSSSSFAVSRQRFKPRTSTEPTDIGKYYELQSQILKNQLKNLKNKYVLRKAEYKEEVQTQNKKIALLEGVIAHNQQEMNVYKAQIQQQITMIRQDMAYKTSPQGLNSFDPIPNRSFYQNQSNQLRQQIVYLRKRTSESTQQIKRMTIENNQLNNRLKEDRQNTSAQDLEILRVDFEAKMRDKDSLISQMDAYIAELTQRQEIANEIVNKNTQLIESLNSEREKCASLQSQLQSKLNADKQGVNQSLVELQSKHDQLVMDYQTTRRQNESLTQDLFYLGASLANLKITNQELQTRLSAQQKNNHIQTTEQLVALQTANQNLNQQLAQMKENVIGMVQETAQQINSLEVRGQVMNNRIRELEEDNLQLIDRLKLDNDPMPRSQLNNPSENGSPEWVRRVQELEQCKVTLEQTLEARDIELAALQSQLRRFGEVYAGQCRTLENIERSHSVELQNQLDQKEYLKSLISNLNSRVEQQASQYLLGVELSNEEDQLESHTNQDETEETPQQQAKTVQQLQEVVSNKNAQIYKLKKIISSCRSNLDNMKSELEMQKLKSVSDRKALESAQQLQLRTLQNDNNSLKQAVQSLQAKIWWLADQNARRDELLMRSISNNVSDDQLGQVKHCLRQYQQLVYPDIIRSGIHSQRFEIERLNNNNVTLMKRIAKLESGLTNTINLTSEGTLQVQSQVLSGMPVMPQ